MRQELTVSVVIPCYNAARTIGSCLAAVLAQTYPIREVIVVDDAGTDESGAIAARTPCTVMRRARNGGVSAARNTGVRASGGDVVFFVDADVALAPDAVANAVAILGRDPGVACVHGSYDLEPLIDDGPVEHYQLIHAAAWRGRLQGEVRTAVFALAAIRRDVLLETGGFDENLRDCEDVEFSGRLPARHRIVLTGTVTGRHDDEATLTGLLAEQWRRSVPLAGMALAARRRGAAGLERAHPPLGVVAAGMVVATLPLGLLGAPWLAVPAAFAVLFGFADPRLPGFVRRARGPAFVPYFMAVHFLVTVVLAAGLAVGVASAVLRGQTWNMTERSAREVGR
ncbi:glycosyltransferase family 2 protein [Sphaerisporangium aureirubrum]|uniref:Glycosyltransferase family 2 protein n=1 Tax=Sphaerisporangium aureirubrum TaxID=1544736 RepID=A0ABW1NI79_9ACTN